MSSLKDKLLSKGKTVQQTHPPAQSEERIPPHPARVAEAIVQSPLAPIVKSGGSRAVAEVIDPGALPALSALPPTLVESFTHLTEDQFSWLSWRLGVATDDEACEIAEIDPLIVARWRGDADFEAVYQRALQNKREGFRVLGTHLLPKALRTINRLLESESVKANQAGLQLLLKTQALLDQPQQDKTDQVTRLLEALRTPGHVVPVSIAPRE